MKAVPSHILHSPLMWATHLQEGKVGKVHPCTGTEALYRSYGP